MFVDWSRHLKFDNPDFSPTFQRIIKRMDEHFDVEIFASRLNFYRCDRNPVVVHPHHLGVWPPSTPAYAGRGVERWGGGGLGGRRTQRRHGLEAVPSRLARVRGGRQEGGLHGGGVVRRRAFAGVPAPVGP